ncbi:hypothetical protein NE237_015717 [Protea cynaroides]|uniref:Uncharacterized protein n=1 Tax=Protea cynaroides TaxID=273540 RepID=A0A9Q0KEU5_9MAGN|nr:hypothetical protein NE237_015717 [Protea cynaroides]
MLHYTWCPDQTLCHMLCINESVSSARTVVASYHRCYYWMAILCDMYYQHKTKRGYSEACRCTQPKQCLSTRDPEALLHKTYMELMLITNYLYQDIYCTSNSSGSCDHSPSHF